VHVKEIDAAIQLFQGAGGTIRVPKQEIPGVGFTAIGLDPEGNAVIIRTSQTTSTKTHEASKEEDCEKETKIEPNSLSLEGFQHQFTNAPK
jgi:hypothetical protein